jgi:tetratricopeptide (TPR) repeat protein
MFVRPCATAVVAAALLACAETPQKRPLATNGGTTVEHTPIGDEPGGAKSARACTSLGLAKDGVAADGSVARDAALAEKELERGNALFLTGEYTAALVAYENAVRADPFQGLAHLGIAETHLYTDNDQSVMKSSLSRALSLMPTNPRAHLFAGDLAVESGEVPRAEAHFRCALELRPDYADAQKRLAKHLFDQQRYPEAEEVVGKIAAEDDVEITVLAADILEASKKYLEAAQKVEVAAGQVKTSAALWRRAAGLYEGAGQLVDAKRARAAADKLDPPEKERALRPLPKARKR